MRIKVINPNTSTAMTAQIGASAAAVAAPSSVIVAVNPRHGPASLEGHHDEAMSLPGLLAEVAAGERDGFDGYVIACFGDPGLYAARELAKGPVIGIAEAAMHMASLIAPGFSVVTTLQRTVGMAHLLAERYGMTRFCRSVRACEVPVLALEVPAPEVYLRILQECQRALAADGAEAIVLGCAGMAALCERLGRDLGVPVIDGVSAAVVMVEGLLRLGLGTAKTGEWAYPRAKDGESSGCP